MQNDSTNSLRLLKFYKYTKNWSSFHEGVSIIYCYVLIPLISFLLKQIDKDIIEIYPRNSLIEKNSFNAFMSDIDLTWIIVDDYSPKKLAYALKLFTFMSRIFPFLDNPEIYLESEEMIRKDTFKMPDINKIYKSLWLIRKRKWQDDILNKSKSKYHQTKASRSLSSINKKLFLDSNKEYDKKICLDNTSLPSLIKNAPDYEKNVPRIYSYYLSMNLFECGEMFIRGNKAEIIKLLTVIPEIDFVTEDTEFNNFIKVNRTYQFNNIILLELLLGMSSLRTSKNINKKALSGFIKYLMEIKMIDKKLFSLKEYGQLLAEHNV